MHRTLAAGLVLAMTALPATAQEGLVTLDSPHSVETTMDQLVAAVEGAGATVFARVDHAAGAQSVGTEIPPVQMLMFGNPALGTPVIAADPAAGLDLPMRVVVYEEADGSVTVAYRQPAAIAAEHEVPADAEALAKMTTALQRLTTAAVE